MKSNTLSPFDLFGNQVRYTVPLFQRPYVWNESRQWQPLWEDVRTVVDRILENKEAQASGAKPTHAVPHFLGAIVLDQKMVPTGFIQERHVIDGQQRLTTLQLLLDAAQEVVAEWGSAADASALGNLILNNVNQIAQPDEVFKVWPTNYDREAFRAAMASEVQVSSDLENSPIVSAHSFFKREVKEWADVTGDPEKVAMRLNALVLALSQYLRLVVIDLEEGDNAQVIFETLNYRGTPLLAADLVKNFIFREAEAQGLDAESLYENWWQSFDSDYWRKRIGSGRNQRPRVDVVLNYWLIMRTTHEVPGDRIFTDFADYVRFSDEPLEEIVSDMNRHADVYVDLQEFDPYSVEGTFSYRVLEVLGQGILTPIVLWLLGKPEGRVSDDQRAKALRALESWAVRRMVTRRPTKNLNRFVIDLLEELESRVDEKPGDVIIDVLLESELEGSDWPKDPEVREALQKTSVYTTITRARLRMLLEALEDDVRTPKSEQEHCPRGNLTIEHVMPQGWREHWQLPGHEHPEVEAAHRDSQIHTIGNLTLVNNRLNPVLSNRPWTDAEALERGLGAQGKRSILDDHSVLLLNHRIIQDNVDYWDESCITTRSDLAADRITRIWRRQHRVGQSDEHDPR